MFKRLVIIAVITAAITTLCVGVAWLLKPPTEADAEEVFWKAHGILTHAGSPQDLSNAAKKFHKALAMYQEAEIPWGEARTLSRLADIHERLEDYPKAIEYDEKSFRIRDESGDARGAAHTLYHIAQIYRASGQQAQAEEYWKQAASACAEIGEQKWEGRALASIAALCLENRRDSEAVGHLQRALPFVQNGGDQKLEAAVLAHMAVAYHRLGQEIRALECYDECMSIARKLGISQILEAEIRGAISDDTSNSDDTLRDSDP